MLENFLPHSFGDLNAEDYDDAHNPGNTDATVDFIYDLAAGGKTLELAIGTGRIGLPLAARGLPVSGIEASDKMVAKLREKPGGADIPVVIGDMADVAMDGSFDHIFLVFNTLFNLTSQAAQIRLFQNVAKRLAPGGTFLIETYVPDFSHFRDGQMLKTKQLDMKSLWIEAATHDRAAQIIEFQRVRITPQGMRLVPLVMRYAYPPEIDLMAMNAGLTLVNRYADWDKSEFTATSGSHISIYQKPS